MGGVGPAPTCVMKNESHSVFVDGSLNDSPPTHLDSIDFISLFSRVLDFLYFVITFSVMWCTY